MSLLIAERLDYMTFRDPFQPELFYDSMIYIYIYTHYMDCIYVMKRSWQEAPVSEVSKAKVTACVQNSCEKLFPGSIFSHARGTRTPSGETPMTGR